MNDPFLWWQRGVIYQIYPRSFMDSNGDGVGDLPGIISKLDYLQWLGVDAVWISPIFPSPMADFGYDVSDYTDIHPLFGTLADFDRLIAEAHRRSLKVILDYVPNHTSDQHPWFVASRSSRHHPKRDWYIWRDPAPDGGPPNNWRSVFGGSASTIIMPISHSSPTSTGGTLRCKPPCWTCCASGSNVASTASGWMPCAS
jgi:alpha-glucosidase